jgi:hypothetical protein
MCYFIILWIIFGFYQINAEHWVIVKIKINGTTEWEDGTNFPPISNIFTINITKNISDNISNHTVGRELLLTFDDEPKIYTENKISWIQTVDKTLLGHIVFFAIVDIIAIIAIILVGMNYIKFLNHNNVIRNYQEEYDEEEYPVENETLIL